MNSVGLMVSGFLAAFIISFVVVMVLMNATERHYEEDDK